jgi:hypothetical protein
MLGQDAHIQISQLWEYSRDPGTLESRQLEHLCCCEDCMGILWLCRAFERFQQVKNKLKEHGIAAD